MGDTLALLMGDRLGNPLTALLRVTRIGEFLNYPRIEPNMALTRGVGA
jgi:hypothetical protein